MIDLLRKRIRPGHRITQFRVSKADIRADKEKEEEWGNMNR
jgi:hypothetical protein